MRVDQEKSGFLLLAVVSLLGIVILAAALDGFTFALPSQLEQTRGEMVDQTQPFEWTRLVVFIVFLMLPLVTILLLLASRRRRRMLLFLLALVLIAYLISTSSSGEQPMDVAPLVTITPEVQYSELVTPEPTLLAPLEAEEVVVTPALVWLLSLGLVGIFVGAVSLVWLVWRTYRHKSSPLQDVITSAETALRALAQEEDVRGTILRCYQEMLAAAVKMKGVERPDYLTPAEFIQRLVKAGLPFEPVERLTHLFELVRYSPQPSTAAMEAEAVTCLQSVIAGTKERT